MAIRRHSQQRQKWFEGKDGISACVDNPWNRRRCGTIATLMRCTALAVYDTFARGAYQIVNAER